MKSLEIEIKPEINDWKLKYIQNSLYILLINMKCSELDCPNLAIKMFKIDDQNKDLRWKDHIFSLTKNKSNYRDLEFFWSDIKNTLANTKDEIMRWQVLLSTIESKEYIEMLGIQRLEKLEKIKDKLNRNLAGFEEKVTKVKLNSNFDIFAFLQQQISAIDKNIQTVYNMIGPFLSETYAAKILQRIRLIEEEELNWIKEQKEFEETADNDEEEKKEIEPSLGRTNGTIFTLDNINK